MADTSGEICTFSGGGGGGGGTEHSGPATILVWDT